MQQGDGRASSWARLTKEREDQFTKSERVNST